MHTFSNDIVHSFPNILEIAFQPIQKSYLKVILLNRFLALFISFGVIITLDMIDFLDFDDYFIWIYIVFGLFFSGLILVAILGFQKRMYLVREKDISYKEGLFFKTITTVPFQRIQHLEIDQGPFSRIFNLASISVFTAGDASDDLTIGGLLKEDAIRIKEFISNQIDG